MFSNKKIVFEEQNIIRADVLQQSAMYPNDILQLLFQSYSDGVIEGANIIKATESELTIAPGIIKYNNRIYHTSQETHVRYQKNNAMNYVKVRFLDRELVADGEEYNSEIVVSDTEECFPYEFEIARFIPDTGATLFATVDKLEDFSVAHNYVDVRFAKYAMQGGDTISPAVTYMFAKEMLACDGKSDVDMAFIFKCLEKRPINREAIGAYISYKRSNRTLVYSNEQIYIELVAILREAKKRRGPQRTENQRGFRSILVD